MTKEIPLTQGQIALVDDEDYERVIQRGKWFAQKDYGTGKFYAKVWVNESPYKLPLQNFILPPPPGMVTDHIDRDRLNCQKHNLRIATHAQNVRNRSKPCHNTSGFMGVFFIKQRRKYTAKITSNGIHYHLGTFDNPEDAAYIYDIAAKILHGKFASLNFLDSTIDF